MNIQEKLDFFRQLIQCNHNLSLRSYDPAFILAHSDIMHEAALADDTALILLSLEEPIRKHVENKIHEPLFIDDHLSLIWIVAFEYEEDSLRGIHTLGPAYSGRNSYQNIKKELDKHDLSVSNRIKVFKLFDHIPIIPTNQLFQYAVMLHYCVTGKQITTNDLHFSEKASGKPSSHEINLITEEHRGIWIAEQEFMNRLREGNPN